MAGTEVSRGDRAALAGGVAFAVLYSFAIWALGDRLALVPHLPDQGASWYFWKLAEPTLQSRLGAWVPYAVHQVGNFAIIAAAQRARPAWGTSLHRFNVWALVFNGLFAVLHLAQTHWTYDGLAQDVHVFTSFASVAVLLIWVLLLENPRRGLFFGKKVPVAQDAMAFARRYHGYYFSWAITYTFWFHPAEPTPGHLLGFFYILLIMLQGSLFFTRVHTNRYWTLALETLVVAHGTVVALSQPEQMWAMFLFGFTSLFVVTQMHGLGWPRWSRWALGVAWGLAVVAVYSQRGFDAINEVIRIPAIDYPGVFLVAGLCTLFARVGRRFARPQATTG